MAARQLTIVLLANLKKNAPHLPGEAPDAHDDLDSEKTLEALKISLESAGHRVVVLEGHIDVMKPLRQLKPDIAFNICEMHWGDSREAQIPAILEMLRIPYTGSKLLTMALTQDKPMTKRVLAYHGLPTPEFQELSRADEPLDPKLKFPLFVKPSHEGTGMGISGKSIVANEKELRERVQWVIETYDESALVECFVDGREITMGIIGNPGPEHAWARQAKNGKVLSGSFEEAVNGGPFHFLPPLEVDFAKYRPDERGVYTNYIKVELAEDFHIIVPAPLEPKQLKELQRLTAAAFQVTGSVDVARVDFRLDKHDHDKPYILEINPLPGLCPGISDLCIASECEGIDHAQLVNGILQLAMQRQGVRMPTPTSLKERFPRKTPQVVTRRVPQPA